jgi:hypothetical protein
MEANMTRKLNWESLLAQFLESRRLQPYAWGTNDCCTFSADSILALTGVDIAEEFRGYKDQDGALAAIKRVCGGADAEDAVRWCAKTYQMTEVSPLFAQRGDLLLVQNAGHIIAGIVDMHGKASVVADGGLGQLSIRAAVAGFKV